MGRRVTKDIQAFKREFKASNSIRSSMLAAGYSEHSAAQCTRALPLRLQQYVERQRKKINKYTALAASVDAQTQEDLTRGKLIDNVISGKDNATNSLKLLGQDRRVSMWQADQGGAVILIQPPAQIMEKLAQVIDATPVIPQLPGDMPVTTDDVTPSPRPTTIDDSGL